MTNSALHRIPEYASLEVDPRFVGLIEYLRSVRPKALSTDAHGMIQESGKLEAYLEFLDLIKASFLIPKESKEPTKYHPYTNIPANLPLSQENQ